MSKATVPAGAAGVRGFRIHYGEGIYSITYWKQARGRPVLYASVLLLLGLMAAVLTKGLPLWWMLPLLVPLLFVALLRHMLPATGTFHLSRYLVAVGGRRYDRRKVSSVYLEAPFGKGRALAVDAGGYGVAGLGTAAKALCGTGKEQPQTPGEAKGPADFRPRRAMQAFGAHSCSVGLVIDGQQVALATGLGHKAAATLLEWVAEIMRVA